MGYQLWFWDQDDDTAGHPDETLRLLGAEEPAPGLQPLPLPEIRDRLLEELPNSGLLPEGRPPTQLMWESDGLTSVECWWSEQHIAAELRPAGLWSRDIANRIIDVMLEFGLPLFDPQTGERFDSLPLA